MSGDARAIKLCAGPLSAVFENGALHTITAFGVEIWRGVMFLYRDAAWRTPATAVRHVLLDADGASFRLTFDARCCIEPTIEWHAAVEGTREGSIRFTVDACAVDDLSANRAGLCVLHPLAFAGARVDIEHIDGRVSQSSFPVLISPWQPFTNIRGLRHEFAPGCRASCRLDGDVFEMEDQRNFSDASYKTYSSSNLMVKPYRLVAGEPIRQSVTLALERCTAPAARSRPRDPRVEVSATRAGRLPRLGLTLPFGEDARRLRPALWHVTIDRATAAAMSRVEWDTIRTAARAASVAIELSLADERDAASQCRELAARLAAIGVTPESVAIFPTTRRAVSAARAAFVHVPIGGGTPWFFTHLNRASLPADQIDFITFRTCPIVHVADDRSVMQTLATLPSIIATLRARYPGIPFRVGPSSISMNVNPFGPWAEEDQPTPVAMARHDGRDEAPFGVAWSLGYLARFACRGGADVVTFASPAVLDALASLAAPAGGWLRESSVSDDRVAAVAVETAAGIEIRIANLTGEPARVSVRIDGDLHHAKVAAFDVARLAIG